MTTPAAPATPWVDAMFRGWGYPKHVADFARRLEALVHQQHEALGSIAEYWNGSNNERAMLDACQHNVFVSEEALAAYAAMEKELSNGR